MKLAALKARAWRAVADVRRASTRSGTARVALDALGDPSRRDLGAWCLSTATRHEEYRRRVDPADGSVAVVCVSSRPHLLGDVVDNVCRQAGLDGRRIEVLYVANHADADRIDVADRLSGIGRSTVLVPPAGTSLGAALNLALASTDARFVAKFDDDDRYGPSYLADSLRAHAYAGVGIVGKHTYYAHLAERDEMILRFPGNEFTYTGTLAGGSLLIDRERVGDVEFPDLSLGEDREFIARCHRRGISTFAADRFNFVQVRASHNTWQPGDAAFLANTIPVDITRPEHVIER